MRPQALGLSLRRFSFYARNRFELWLRQSLEKAALQGDRFQFCSEMVRVRRIELRSQVWKTCILAAVRHPHTLSIISLFCV